jgi:hypothetical protein
VVSGILYSPIIATDWYTFAVELTTTGVTFYIYDDTGTELNNYYSNAADLRAGYVNEVRYSVSGSAGAIYVDYLFGTGGASQSFSTSGAPSTLDPLASDTEKKISNVIVDPAKVAKSNSGQAVVSAAYGIPDNAFEILSKEELTRAEILEVLGQTPEINQRQKGTYSAVGWENFRGDLEQALKAKIAAFHGVKSNEVYLIDYYIEWLEIGTTLDSNIVAKAEESFWNAFQRNVEDTGGRILTTSGNSDSSLSSMSLSVGSGMNSRYLTMAINPFMPSPLFILPLIIIAGAIIVGMISGAYVMSESSREMAQDFTKITDTLIAQAKADRQFWENNFNETKKDFRDFENRLSNVTTQAYQDLKAGYGSMLTTVRASVNDTVKAITDSIDKVQNGFAQSYQYLQQQWQTTNAMYAQMFNQTADQIRTFNGQIAKTNEAVMNISQGIFSGAYGANFWTDYMGGGKPDTGPLSQVGFFGTNLTTTQVILIVIVAIAIIAAVALVMISRRRPGRRRH